MHSIEKICFKKLLSRFSIQLLQQYFLGFVLIISRPFLLDYILMIIYKLRGTDHYEGESETDEFLFVFFDRILPIIFLISLIFFLKRCVLKKPPKK